MASQPLDDDTLELTDVVDDEPLELPEGHEQADDADDGEEVVTFGDEDAEAEPAAETDLVKHLRKTLRERERELAQTRKTPVAEQPIVVGDRPKIEDLDYDQERFDAELDAWDARREAKRQQDQRIEQQGRQQNEAWEVVKTNYATKKAALRYPDKDQVEATAFEALSAVQQAVIAKVAPDPALFIYAVGKSPARLAQLSTIEDPIVLAAAIGKMGASLTMKKRTPATQPEKVLSGTAPRSSDKTLEKLEAAAAKSGDRSEVLRYKKQQREK